MILDAWQYGNPEFVLERKQELEARKIKGCTGCKHDIKLELETETLHRCAIKPKGWGTANCQQYVSTKGKS